MPNETPPEDLFPPAQRYVYGRSPLVQVILQLKFLPILKIESDIPSEFQERVRSEFPRYQKGAPDNGMRLPVSVAALLQLRPSHQFFSEDSKTTITLTTDAISISTTLYKGWSWFRPLCDLATRALIDVYKPPAFTRIGLRYTDIVVPADLDLKEIHWSRLLNREMLGEIANPKFESALSGLCFRVLALRLPGGRGALLFRHGFGGFPDLPTQPATPHYILDYDVYNEGKTESGNEWKVIDDYHELASRAFHWSISPELHDLLRPIEPVG